MDDNTAIHNNEIENKINTQYIIPVVEMEYTSYGPTPRRLWKEHIDLKKDFQDLKDKFYNNLEKESAILRNQNDSLCDQLKILQNENAKLNGEIKTIQSEYSNIKTQCAHLTEENKKLQDQVNNLIIKIEDIRNLNEFSDIFRYFREYILPNMREEHEADLSERFLAIDEDRILSELNSYRRKKNINDPKLDDIKKLLSMIDLDLPTTIKFIQLNESRNNTTHFIDQEYYNDQKYVNKMLNKYKNKINNLYPENSLYIYKTNIIKFINALLKV